MRRIDATREKIESLTTEAAASSIIRTTFMELNKIVLKKAERPPTMSGNRWDAPTITPYLICCRNVVEQELIASVAGYNCLRWLWYLRRLPRHIFQGVLPTTYGYDTALAEILSGYGGTEATAHVSIGSTHAY